MFRRTLPRSIRKFLRRRKAKIRRQFLSSLEADAAIRELVGEVRQRYHRGEVTKVAKAAKGTKEVKATNETKVIKTAEATEGTNVPRATKPTKATKVAKEAKATRK